MSAWGVFDNLITHEKHVMPCTWEGSPRQGHIAEHYCPCCPVRDEQAGAVWIHNETEERGALN